VSESLDASARSDTGAVRAVNEDSFIARSPVFLVADGMGGHARGDKASQEAVRIFDERIPADSIPTPDDVLDAVAAANKGVRGLSEVDDSGVAVAGTTLTGAVLVKTSDGEDRHWMVVNVGDSRVYNWDGRTLTQLSVDHSAVQELLDAGVISPDEAAVHPERNVITRALGADSAVEVDVWLLPAAGHQTFLVCSDGLSKELSDEQIAQILADHGDGHDESSAASTADALVAAALDAGGRDNVTVIVVESQRGKSGGDADLTIDRIAGTSEFLEDTRPRS
jgi:serine/threonine protein phosphatase PrpC